MLDLRRVAASARAVSVIHKIMPTLSKTKASLRVIGDELSPEEISELLGCQPTVKMIKGEPFSWMSNGKPRIARSGMWRIEANEKMPGDLDCQIFEILNKLTHDLEVWKKISEKYRLDLFCGLFMGGSMEGISISSEALLALGQRGVEIDFDMYGPDDEDV
ncbi:DUF4279 domain-containing protein [Microbulbifer sp. CnH-101-G]|uniref:DUF4279 domain-containing protein n=1 Tax=Microbulbifer sp. CnH-101-G TaxID=3243393 RepID=UPI004039F806